MIKEVATALTESMPLSSRPRNFTRDRSVSQCKTVRNFDQTEVRILAVF